MLNLSDGIKAVQYARDIIESHVKNLKPSSSKLDKIFYEKQGAFVTIHTFPEKNLRGCIGIPMPIMPLKNALADSARSATRDPRFNPLSEEDLVEVLTKPKNALTKQYKKYFDMEGVNLEFKDEALAEVAKLAIKKKTGARALRSILEDAMLEVMYEMPSESGMTECVITEECIRKKAKPELTSKSTKKKKVA